MTAGLVLYSWVDEDIDNEQREQGGPSRQVVHYDVLVLCVSSGPYGSKAVKRWSSSCRRQVAV